MINNNFSLNQEQISTHLSALGYKKGDTVFLRAFLPSNHPDKNNDKGRKAQLINLTELIKTATEWQQQGLGVYLVVNGGGHTDKEVVDCRAIFYEHDNLDKESQVTLWQYLNLPTPTFQIDTGGKSIHSYWVLKEHITPDDWKLLQTDLLEYADADRSLKNPSRVMRLAGCLHGSGQPSTIISESGNTYTFTELRSIIPVKKTTAPASYAPSSDISDWGDMRKISPYLEGYKLGGRKGWITCKCPVHGGVSLDSLHINESTGQFHCHRQCDTKEIFRVSLEIAKSKGYIVPPNAQPQRNNQTQSHTKTYIDSLIKEVDSLIDRDLPKSQLEAIIPEIAERTSRTSSDIRRIYEALKRERQSTEEQQEVIEQIPKVIEAQQTRIDPHSILWGDGGRLAQLLKSVAIAMPTSVENLITTLIPVVGSRIGTAARIIINPSSKYTQPAIFWSCVVAETGRLKTPAQEVIISPLMKLEAEEYNWWKDFQEEYEQELKTYKKSSDAEPPTPPPPRKRFIVQGATSETRIKLHAENPRGFLNYRDEWSAFINGRNKYRNGKGDDLEIDLSEFNGGGIFKDTASESLFLEKSAISRTGNTQPETLQKFLAQQDFEDYTGEFARWLFCLVPGDIAYIDLFKGNDEAGQLLETALIDLYRKVGTLPKNDYFLTEGAKGVLQSYHRWLTDAEIQETHPGLRAAYPKIKSYLARLALWLHIVNAALANEYPEQMISGSTMYAACTLTNFYLAQIKIVYNVNGQHLTGKLLKIKDYIEKRDGVTAREIKAGVFSLRKIPTSEVLSSCMSLKNLGLVFFDGKKFYSSKNINNINTSPETFTTQDVEGVDPRSTMINTFDDTETETFAPQAVEGVDPMINSSENVAVDTFKSNVITEQEQKSVDLVDQLLIRDQHPQTQSPQELQSFVDVVDPISEENLFQCEETACDDVSDEVAETIKDQFPIGSWVRWENQLAQVTDYFENSSTPLSLFVDGQDKSSLFGVKRAEECTKLTQIEMLSLGLSKKLTGVNYSLTPDLIEGCHYWSKSLHKRVKISQIFEQGQDFKNPEALVIPDSGVPARVKLDDLYACHDSPTANFNVKEVVSVIISMNRSEPVAQVGAVTKLDSLGVWVSLLGKKGALQTAKRFFAHRIGRCE
ncbi:hypothetical protein NIES4103_31350 [Nostoc sp. NIES-4103]|nr:hypothetical protein NIES4103_31350 [Nostoc sp. NIES-4103]